MQETYYTNRETGKLEKERMLYGDFIKWVYENPIGKGALHAFFKKKLFTSLYGSFQNTGLSSRKIKKFIKDYNIDMSECTKTASEFATFNDFFTRKLKKKARPVDQDKGTAICVADSKVMAFQRMNIDQLFQVKGSYYSLEGLLGEEHTAEEYRGGSYAVFRLAPYDCHWFHFFDDGYPAGITKTEGDYYCLNRLSLSQVAELYCKNKRHVTTFYSDNFGEAAHVEVGATCVGSIVQGFNIGRVKKGDEKGHFSFGGSTILLFFRKNQVRFCDDLVGNTKKGLETKVKFGTPLGRKP